LRKTFERLYKEFLSQSHKFACFISEERSAAILIESKMFLYSTNQTFLFSYFNNLHVYIKILASYIMTKHCLYHNTRSNA